MSSFFVLIGLYLVAGTAISLAVMRKNRTQSDYFVGGGAIGWVVSAMTYAATTYSAFMMVGLVGLSYAAGVGSLIFELVYLVGTVLLLSLFGGRIWDLARQKHAVSPMELFASQYGRPAATVGSVVAALALIPYTAVQVIGLAVILEGFGLPFTGGVVFAVAVIGLWSFLGGLRGVAITDALQGFFMLTISIAALIWVSRSYQGYEFSTFPNELWTPAFFVNLTLPWAFFALTNPQVLQRIFILKERKDLPKMIILFAVFGLIYTLIVTLVGYGARYGSNQGLFSPSAGGDRIIVELMASMGQALAIPLALSIVFASVSTANSILLTLSSMFTRDVLKKTDSPNMGRIAIAALAVIVGAFALTRPEGLVQLSVSSSRILMVFLPLLAGLFYVPSAGRYAGMLTLVAGGGLAIAFGFLVPTYSSVVSLATLVVLFVVGTLIDRKTAQVP